VEQLRPSGGWTFKSGIIDPEKHPFLVIEFDVRMANVGTSKTIGIMHVPVFQGRYLSDPQAPFKNQWLPLVTIGQDGQYVSNLTGEIHIMTRWLPAEMIQIMADGTQKQQMSVRSMFLKELWPRIVAQRLKEPVYNIEPQYLHYNPNLVKDKAGKKRAPEAPKDHVRRNAEQLVSAVEYDACQGRRQLQAWKDFDKTIDEEMPGIAVGECLLFWRQSGQFERLEQVSQLVQRGIPSQMRERLWRELTLASRVMERGPDGFANPRSEVGEAAIRAAEKDYERFLERGRSITSDSTHQLIEDCMNLGSWESSTPPTPEVFDIHLSRIKQAQNVVTALLAVPAGGIAYCESLLVLAFFMLLPQGNVEDKVQGERPSQFSEATVFWMLYTLICERMNGAYREYYGTPPPELAVPEEPPQRSSSLMAGNGAIQDVHLLECCLAYHEPGLWNAMNRLGFTLATVFYGAFMRLYATYMPTVSVFRFWDLLFAYSTEPNPQPHQRVYLIDLAFGVLSSRKADIQMCNSAHEVKTLILGAFGALYDTSTVIDIAILSHTHLWEGGGFASSKVSALWRQRVDLFRLASETVASQNEVLKALTHTSSIGIRMPQEQQLAGVTTDDLLKKAVIRKLKDVKKNGMKKTWGMFRPMPLATRVLSANTLEQAWQQFQESIRTTPVVPPNPFRICPMQPRSDLSYGTNNLEPRDITSTDLANALDGDPELRPWGPHATAIWNAFNNRRDRLLLMGAGLGFYDAYDATENPNAPLTGSYGGYGPPKQTMLQKMLTSMGVSLDNTSHFGTGPLGTSDESQLDNIDHEQFSLNEFIMALICASRGTLAEKANVLFNVYQYPEKKANPTDNHHHIVPVSKLAKSICMASGQDNANENLTPPIPDSKEAVEQNILRFEVWTDWPNTHRLGDVFIKNLGPYLQASNAQEPQFMSHNIWGKMPGKRAKPGRPTGAAGSVPPAGKDELVCLGEISMGIAWVPESAMVSYKGQLSIHVRHIKFFPMYVSDYFKINPEIKVFYSIDCPPPKQSKITDAERDWALVQRWDPRGLFSTQQKSSWVTTVGPYGGHVLFEKTMRGGMLSGSDSTSGYYSSSRKGMGWNKKENTWVWNDTWGLQRSIESMPVDELFVKASSKNVLDIQGARLITAHILQRCNLSVTNRQACLIADSVFNRLGVVPGILRAIVVPGDVITRKPLAEIEEECKKSGMSYKDVTDKICLEQENQIARNGCTLNLFAKNWLELPDGSGYREYGFKHMNMSDPFPKQQKVLWIRFVRGGDGERITYPVRFDAEGNVVGPDPEVGYDPEVPMEQIDVWPQTKISREEFISCLVASPLLGESLRQLGNCEQILQTKKMLSLDVSVMDPHHEEEDEQIQDVLDVQQSILLEVWDSDTMSKDFLGEVWLPPLSTFTKHQKSLVLPLGKADFSENAENGPSRADPKKEITGEDKDPNKKITGELFVTVSWDYPVYKPLDSVTDMHEWMEKDLQVQTKDLDKKISHGKHSGQTRPVALEKIIESYGDGMPGLTGLARDRSRVDEDGVLTKTFVDELQLSKDEKAKMQHFFQDHLETDDVNQRASVQEKLHTGRLSLTINKARMLRRSDAAKRKDCDPSVYVYVRNDHQNAFRKRWLFRTHTVWNNRNPEWNYSQTKELLTGSYEARYKLPEEGYAAVLKRAFQTSKQRRHYQEERSSAMVKRFGRDGLRIVFTEGRQQGMPVQMQQQEPGMNHRMEIALADSIHEFKAKLTEAIGKEADYWKAQPGEKAAELALQYSDVKIGHKHLVMTFVEPRQVRKHRTQNKDKNNEEFNRQYKMALADPSNWQPLDPMRSFVHYNQYNFGLGSAAKLIRVVEATEAYKAQNIRYKLYDEEVNKKHWIDTNDKTKCFGYAKYFHKEDDNSIEWRPAIVRRTEKTPQQPGANSVGTNKPYTVEWVFQRSLVEKNANPKGKNAGETVEKMPPPSPRDRSDVLLGPRIPQFEDDVDEEHEEFLDQAPMLRMAGKSDWDIETVLNKLLTDKYEEDKKQDAGLRRPAPITVDEIRTFLQRKEAKDAAAR